MLVKGTPGVRPPRARRVARDGSPRRLVGSGVIDSSALVIVALLIAWPSFGWPLVSMDESVLLVYAEQVRSGGVPHRDFFTVYGPAPFYMLARLFSIFGSALEVERALGLVLHIAIALGCYSLGRQRDRATALLAGSLSLIMLAPLGTVAYAWLGALACLVGAVSLAQRRQRVGDFGAGLLAGLSACFRPELIVVAVAVLAPHLWRSGRWRWTTAGFVAGLSPLAASALVAGPRMWQNIVPGRIGVNGSLRLTDNPGQSLAVLTSLICVTAILVHYAWKRRSRVAVSHVLLALGILPQALQRMDTDHALYTLCITAPLVVVGAAAGPTTADSIRRRRMLVVSTIIAVMGSMSVMVLRPTHETVRVTLSGRSAVIEAQDLPNLMDTRNALLAHAPSGGNVFIGSTDMSRAALSRILVYYLLPELRPRSYYLELAAGISERAHSGLADDLRRADVLLLTPMPEELREQLFPYITKGSDEANRVVASEFCPVNETRWGTVYQHRPCAAPSLP